MIRFLVFSSVVEQLLDNSEVATPQNSISPIYKLLLLSYNYLLTMKELSVSLNYHMCWSRYRTCKWARK